MASRGGSEPVINPGLREKKTFSDVGDGILMFLGITLG